ncbi:acyltransferase family protein [Pseudarthrobacter sp. NamE5]|uniref:acyltransferase family protein n=1 Tax=Pseudarthrobacter sp. NamE5 TaxID=2576839 RepID=UPI001486C82D|nr:acyltransferase family protein [Pseudarthrobacter sp. NamE5]
MRKDIQGLRAIAVGVVVLDHLLKWPSGGYIGVDIFFVISGFLITGILIREHERTGRLSFVDFYRRRLRRIMPVAVLVLVAATAAVSLIQGIGRAKAILVDSTYSLLFAANWHFAAAGTDYMQAHGPVSPVQHYWSLAVEEQFYILWPVLVVLVLGVAVKRFGWHKRRGMQVLRASMVGLTVASFIYACWQSSAEPTWAYFSTFSRAWELGVGALLAVFAVRLSEIPEAVRAGLAWLGVAGVAVALFALNPQSVFPAPWGALPVVATALVIAAGTGGSGSHTPQLLSAWPMQYVGKISYSLYLWHFPTIIISQSIFPQPQRTLVVLVQLVVMVTLSVASFHLVEDPIRKSRWLEDGSPRKTVGGAAPKSRSLGWPKIVLVGVGPAVVALVVSTVVAGVSARLEADIQTAPLDVDPAARASQIKSSLGYEEWPTLAPAVDNLGPDAWVPEWVLDRCHDVWEEDVARCSYGDPEASKTAVLVGDSIAISYMPGIRAALEGDGWKITSLTLQQCPAVDVPVLKDRSSGGGEYIECERHHAWVKDYVSKANPDVLIMSSVQETTQRLANQATGDDAINDWASATARTITQYASVAKKVVLLGPPPGGTNLQLCATALSTPKDCITTRSIEYDKTQAAVFAAVPDDLPNVSVIDTSSWFCGDDNRCPSFVNNTIMFADGGHLTGAYSKKLGPILRSVLVEQQEEQPQ